jgi:phosphopantothenoylcysteine decarboxylase/phosphopantothenate--cysteine ligase
MGYALARAALCAGATVTLISGKTSLSPPMGVQLISVESAQNMFDEVNRHLPADIFIASAAVADYRVSESSIQKIKKTQQNARHLALELNPDILAHVASHKLAAYCVGFAAETQNVIHNAQQKLTQKNCHMMIANHVNQHKGFDQEENQVSILTSGQIIELPLMHKTRLAKEIIQAIGAQHNSR